MSEINELIPTVLASQGAVRAALAVRDTLPRIQESKTGELLRKIKSRLEERLPGWKVAPTSGSSFWSGREGSLGVRKPEWKLRSIYLQRQGGDLADRMILGVGLGLRPREDRPNRDRFEKAANVLLQSHHNWTFDERRNDWFEVYVCLGGPYHQLSSPEGLWRIAGQTDAAADELADWMVEMARAMEALVDAEEAEEAEEQGLGHAVSGRDPVGEISS